MDIRSLKRYFYRNVVSSLLTIMVLAGGSVVTIYYGGIMYMPSLDWQAFLPLLGAVASLSFVTLMLTMFIFVAPGASWAYLWGRQSKLKHHWTDAQKFETYGGVLLWFLVPVLFAVMLLVLIAYSLIVGIIAIAAISLGCFLLFGKLCNGSFIPKTGKKFLVVLKTEFHFLGVVSVSAVLLAIPLTFILSLSLHPEVGTVFSRWINAFIALSFILFCNMSATIQPRSKIPQIPWLLILGFTSLFIVENLYGTFHHFYENMVSRYGIGHIQTENMVFRKEACDYLSSIDPLMKVEMAKPDGACSVHNLLILNRLGSEAYLQYTEGTKLLRFTIPSADIESWSVHADQPGTPVQQVSKALKLGGE